MGLSSCCSASDTKHNQAWSLSQCLHARHVQTVARDAVSTSTLRSQTAAPSAAGGPWRETPAGVVCHVVAGPSRSPRDAQPDCQPWWIHKGQTDCYTCEAPECWLTWWPFCPVDCPRSSTHDQAVLCLQIVAGVMTKWVNLGQGWRHRLFVLRDGRLRYYRVSRAAGV